MPREKRFPYWLSANGVVDRITNGKHEVRERAILLKVIDKQGGCCRAISKHHGADSPVK
jgi:hypothetical protein